MVTDEVYEHLVFDGAAHVPVATLPGMADRTITISSGGKTFSATGLEGRLAVGPEEAVTAARTVKQFLTYVASGPFQPAVAVALGLGDEVYAGAGHVAAGQARPAVRGAARPGCRCRGPRGPTSSSPMRRRSGRATELEFCRRLPELAGVVGVPVSVFHDDVDAARTLVRFAFCKRDEVLIEAAERLGRLHSS